MAKRRFLHRDDRTEQPGSYATSCRAGKGKPKQKYNGTSKAKLSKFLPNRLQIEKYCAPPCSLDLNVLLHL